jgi:hypothetical protein
VDEVGVTVVVPPPTVAIATPESQTIVLTNPVTVAGTVDDPLATITVNGAATPNNNGAYSKTDVMLTEGGNTITVIATNGTGDGMASVDVLFKTQPAPVIVITSPSPNFTANRVWDGIGASPLNDFPIVVSGTVATVSASGTPTVMVNDFPATVNPLGCPPGLFCIWTTLASRYSFSAEIQLSKGSQTIMAIGSDTLGGSAQAQVGGVADYCRIGEAESGVAAERGNGQNNRCHFVDGCSAPGSGDNSPSDARRNQPMPNASQNLVLVEFGSGSIPPSEFFVHGQSPQRPLGCNIHDGCYQTCVPQGGGARAAAYNACNLQQRDNHKAMCRQAYPATCPYTGQPFRCLDWKAEKANCFALAESYFSAVEVGGFMKYNDRQNDFCLN